MVWFCNLLNLFLAVLGLCCCAPAFSSCGEWGLLFVAAHELITVGFPRRSAGKESACNAGDLGLIPGLGRSPGERKSYPTPVFWTGEFHGLYSPWGYKESDMTEQPSYCRAQALDARASAAAAGRLRNCDLLALGHTGFSSCRAQT